jgi:hypothetical protein
VDVNPFAAPETAAPLGGSAGSAARVPIVDAVANADASGTAILACAGALDAPIRATIHGLAPLAAGADIVRSR